MRYVLARLKVYHREEAYRIYVTDSLRALGNLNVRYVDVIKPQKIETRTSDEIIDHIRGELK